MPDSLSGPSFAKRLAMTSVAICKRFYGFFLPIFGIWAILLAALPGHATLPFDSQIGQSAIERIFADRKGHCDLNWDGSSALVQQYRSLLRNPQTTPDTFIKEMLVRTKCVPVEKQKEIYTEFGSYLFQLFPQMSYEMAEAKIRGLLKVEGLDNIIALLPLIKGIDRPEDCPNTTLLNRASSSKPLRRTQQLYGNCYVHAGVRAMDYLLFSKNPNYPNSSILSASLQVNSSRRGQDINIDGGFVRAVVSSMKRFGVCGETPLDKLPGDQGEKRLQELELARREMSSLLQVLNGKMEILSIEKMQKAAQGDQQQKQMVSATLAKFMTLADLTSRWSPTTMDLFVRASKPTKTLSSPTEMIGQVNLIIELTNEYWERAPKAGAFMNFADFVFRKAYCRENLIFFPEFEVKSLFSGVSFFRTLSTLWTGQSLFAESEWADVRSGIAQQFRKQNAQPVVTHLCAGIFSGMRTTKNLHARECGHHAVLLVGQKYNHSLKQCTYQILNSWGGSTDSYDPRYETEPDLGTIWLPSHQFSNAVWELDYLEAR